MVRMPVGQSFLPLFRPMRRGLTLAELMVVLAILGIVTAVTLPRLAGIRAVEYHSRFATWNARRQAHGLPPREGEAVVAWRVQPFPGGRHQRERNRPVGVGRRRGEGGDMKHPTEPAVSGYEYRVRVAAEV